MNPGPRRALAHEDAPGFGPGRSARPSRASRRHSRRLVTLVVVLALVVAVAGVGLIIYQRLNGNLKAVALPADVQQRGRPGDPTVSGISPGAAENILVIGSDTRSNSQDCSLGGACSPAQATGGTGADLSTVGAHADVEILVHISADRSNMTVMSIPRDTMMTVPACTGNGASEVPHYDRINSTLSFGPACTVTAVHDLTGLAINHFIMVDFSGVVQISDAVGGVTICVDNNVYDPYSHLKLTKGTHTLKGIAALEFLRTRHGFGDGSDIGRTVAQHLFLAAVQRQVESAGTLLNPVTLYHLADTATKAVTVDTGLASVSDLARLAVTVAKVPTNRTTFITMPTVPDPQNINVVIPAASAQDLFTKIADDVSLTAPPKAPAPKAGSSATSHAASTTPHTTAPRTSAPATTAAVSGPSDFQQTASSATGCAQVSNQYTVSLNGVGMTPVQAFAASPNVPLSAP